MEKNTMEANGYRQLFGYHHSSFVLKRRKKHTILEQHDGW